MHEPGVLGSVFSPYRGRPQGRNPLVCKPAGFVDLCSRCAQSEGVCMGGCGFVWLKSERAFFVCAARIVRAHPVVCVAGFV